MKTLVLGLAAATGILGFAENAEAAGRRTYSTRHCGACIPIFEQTCRERREVKACEQVLVGHREEVVGYRDEVVGYEDVWVDRCETRYVTRTVYRQVVVGRDRCGRPVYAARPACERVPVTRTVRVCEKRPVVRKVPVSETRPVYETREVVRHEWVDVPRGLYVCVR